MKPLPGFSIIDHEFYVAAGGCPYVEGKTWCNGRSGDGHAVHWAPYLESSTKTRRVVLHDAQLLDEGEA